MKILQANDSLALLPSQTLSFCSQSSLWLRVDIGSVWITKLGSLDDYWLHAGDSVVLDANPHIVLEAGDTFTRLDVLPLTQGQRQLQPMLASRPSLRQSWPFLHQSRQHST